MRFHITLPVEYLSADFDGHKIFVFRPVVKCGMAHAEFIHDLLFGQIVFLGCAYHNREKLRLCSGYKVSGEIGEVFNGDAQGNSSDTALYKGI